MDKKFFSGANAAKTLAAFAVLGGLFFAGRKAFLDSRRQFPIYPSSGVSRVAHLSEYFGGVKGTAADSEVYVFDSGKPGASVLILGGRTRRRGGADREYPRHAGARVHRAEGQRQRADAHDAS